MFVLQVTRGPDQGKKLLLEAGKTYTIGCNGDASLVLSDPLVLKGHCSLEIANGAVVLKNHTVSAGTFVGDEKVSQATLKPTSSFRIGATVLTLTAAPVPKTAPPPAPPDPFVGKIVGGYKLNELVGAGGMGKVFRATQLSLHREVAFKILRDQHVKDKSFRDLFINEARAAAQLVHPNVVQVYDAGNEGDLVFFSMEFLGKGSIEEILEKEKKIPWEQAILQVLEAAHGLDYAESKGIVHRDIKPDNLMLNEAGQVKIADLGLAKRGEGDQDAGVIGTPHFIPPEQALGKAVDHRADQYSLGATFFRMITGRTLFSGKTAKEIVLKHIKEPPPAASSVEPAVPDDLDLVIAKMLSKEPDKRYPSAKEVIAALEEVCAHHGIKGSIIKKGVGRRVLIPLMLLLLAAGGAVYYFAYLKPEDPARVAERDRLRREADEKAAEARKAEKDRLAMAAQARKGEAENRLLTRDNQRGILANECPISSVYDDEAKVAQLEAKWLALANDYEDFGKSDLAKEFEQEKSYSSDALRRAKEIRDSLAQYKASAADMKEKSAAKLKEANVLDTKLRAQLAEMSAKAQYERAANLCELISTGKPPKEDPFSPIATWEWVSPTNAVPPRPWSEFREIKKVIDDARNYFKGQKQAVYDGASAVAEPVIKEAQQLPEVAETSAIEAVIKKLQAIRDFRDPDEKAVKDKVIGGLIGRAQQEQGRLEAILRARGGKVLSEDRLTVRDLQRRLCSMSPDQTPNTLMQCDFDKVIGNWNEFLADERIKTDVYRRFAKERIAMAGWCQWLFARFSADVQETAKGVAPAPLKILNLDQIPFPDGGVVTGALLNGKEQDPLRFGSSKEYKRETSFPYGRFPMDWVYNGVFLYKGEARWATMTPELHFALGAFCYETMQYKDAVRHFGEVLKSEANGKYAPAATCLRARAELEAKAREAYEALLEEKAKAIALEDPAAAVAALSALRVKVNAYAAEHEGTMFYLDAMDFSDEIKFDFFDLKYPEIPTPPPLPKAKE